MNESIQTCFGDDHPVYHDASFIRKKVFVEEQRISITKERDGMDSAAHHFVAYCNGKPIACARMIVAEDEAKIGRIAVLPAYRNKGVASRICQGCIAFSQEQGIAMLYLYAQTYTAKLYKNLGFIHIGEIFYVENIPHIRMEKTISNV